MFDRMKEKYTTKGNVVHDAIESMLDNYPFHLVKDKKEAADSIAFLIANYASIICSDTDFEYRSEDIDAFTDSHGYARLSDEDKAYIKDLLDDNEYLMESEMDFLRDTIRDVMEEKGLYRVVRCPSCHSEYYESYLTMIESQGDLFAVCPDCGHQDHRSAFDFDDKSSK